MYAYTTYFVRWLLTWVLGKSRTQLFASVGDHNGPLIIVITLISIVIFLFTSEFPTKNIHYSAVLFSPNKTELESERTQCHWPQVPWIGWKMSLILIHICGLRSRFHASPILFVCDCITMKSTGQAHLILLDNCGFQYQLEPSKRPPSQWNTQDLSKHRTNHSKPRNQWQLSSKNSSQVKLRNGGYLRLQLLYWMAANLSTEYHN